MRCGSKFIMKNLNGPFAPLLGILLCLLAAVFIPSIVSAAQVTTPVTAGSGQTVLIPTDQSIHVPSGNAISATGGGIISGTGITAATDGDTAAVNSSGAGSAVSLDGNTVLTGARGGAWMAGGGLVRLGSGAVINVTGSSTGSAGIYVNNSNAPADTFGSGITVNMNGAHVNNNAWIGVAVGGASGSASFDNLTVQGASADVGAMATQGATLNLTNSNIMVNGRIIGNDLFLWQTTPGIGFTFVTNMGISAHISSHLNVSGTNVTVGTLDSGVAMGISVYDNSTLDLHDSTIAMTGTTAAGTPIAAGLYMSNGDNSVTVSNSRITTAGDNFQGVHLASGSLTADAMSVATAGGQSYGIHITTSPNNPSNIIAIISNSDVTTYGVNSIGVRINNADAVANFTNSIIAAQGADNIGVAVTTGGGNANLSMSGGALTSTGTALQVLGSNAAFSFSNGVAVTPGNGLLLDVQGTGSAALFAGSSAKLTGDIQAATLNSAGVTLGSNAAWSGAARNVGSVAMSGGSLWSMSGDSDVAALSLDNSAVAFKAPDSPYKTLTVRGGYTGNNGLIGLNTRLGDDSSPTDRLVVAGDVSGTSGVVVTNRGGLGARTVDGIRIIEVGGVSPGNAFRLVGDYVTSDGQQAVIGGAYAYTLRRNSLRSLDGNWYLTSQFTRIDPETGLPEVDPETGLPEIDPETGLPEQSPRYQPGVVVFEQYPQVLAALNTVPTLQQRVGNRYWLSPPAAGSGQPANYGVWGRVEGGHTASDPARSASAASRDIDLWKLQTGLDLALYQGKDGSQLIGGVNFSYGAANAEMRSSFGRGKIDTTGYGVGATMTWYAANSFYVDAQAQAMWFDSDLTSKTEGRKLVSGNNGHGYAFSAETGKRYRFGKGFSATPQAQLVYSQVDFDSFNDPFNTRVSLRYGDSLRARYGVSLDHEAAWVAKDGTHSRSHIYGNANLYNEFLNGSKVDVSGVGFSTRDDRLWAGVGAGGTYEWSDGRYALYGNVNVASSTESFGDSYALNGMLGFRVSW